MHYAEKRKPKAYILEGKFRETTVFLIQRKERTQMETLEVKGNRALTIK